MARVLYDGLVDYEDGTKATTSQMAKDVVEFLNWSAEPEMDDRKRMGWKVMAVGGVLFAISIWVKRCVFSYVVRGTDGMADKNSQVQMGQREDPQAVIRPAANEGPEQARQCYGRIGFPEVKIRVR